MDFSIEKYLDLAEQKGDQEAEDYRASFMPEYLYKFVALSNEYDDSSAKRNEKRFDSLLKKRIWLSFPEKLNDPYEMRGFYLNRKELHDVCGLDADAVNLFLSTLQRVPVASLTENMATNLPMWAHYANNHRGYCVKYKVENKYAVRAVIYSERRPDYSKLFSWFLGSAAEYERKPSVDALKRVQFYSLILQTVLYTKHTSWGYEKEYRLVLPGDYDETNRTGINVDSEEIGFIPVSVYAGINCREDHKDRLEEIAKTIGMEYHKCSISEESFTVFE